MEAGSKRVKIEGIEAVPADEADVEDKVYFVFVFFFLTLFFSPL
jgi:hypothetical protein